MIALLAIVCIIGVFVAGAAFGPQTVIGIVMLAVCVVGLGILIAAAETRGFEGQRVLNIPTPLTWEKLWLNVVRMALDRGTVQGGEPVYVQTPMGPQAVTGVFTARINHVVSIVLDTDAPVVDGSHEYNAAKQGVM